ncbi:MAG: hypothetical protein OXN81_07385 [Alphaproteobacteria bacterium]|nr:hypothetical protein [Alphaproteobacteria bacterium]
MTIRIPDNVFEGLLKWMTRDPWSGHLQEAVDDHMGAWCELHDIDSFDDMADRIGMHWVAVLNDMALHDFLGHETGDGNVVDLYLKRRGWRETAIGKAYLQGIQDSAVSLYEVSDIRPGESFLARDLVLGEEPVRVRERTATKTMAPWEHFAMRIVEVRGERFLAGGLLPFEPDLSVEVTEAIHELARQAEDGVERMLKEMPKEVAEEGVAVPPREAIGALAMEMALRMASPLIAETWLMETVFDPADAPVAQLFNSDGDEIEFIRLNYRFARGATQAKIRAIVDIQPDMAPASDRFWNWIDCGRDPSQPDRPEPGEAGRMLISTLDDGSPIRGTIALKGRMLEAETNSVRRAEALQARLAGIVGDLLRPPLMARQTVAQAMAEHEAPDPPDIPPEEEARLLAEFLDRHYRDTLDRPIPMLGDKTPREAVGTASGREEAAAWLKHLERGGAGTRAGRNIPAYDFRWMWRELGIEDLRK